MTRRDVEQTVESLRRGPAFSVASKRFRMNGANFAGAIGPSSICFALRQKGSFLSFEDPLEHVALAAEVHVPDLRLHLETPSA